VDPACPGGPNVTDEEFVGHPGSHGGRAIGLLADLLADWLLVLAHEMGGKEPYPHDRGWVCRGTGAIRAANGVADARALARDRASPRLSLGCRLAVHTGCID
jgi:hypothetical protein